MKITRVAVYQTVLPYSKGVYVWGAGNELRDSKTSVVVLETDAGLSGCGEFAPCGENYMHAHSQGVEAVARLVAPALLGEDPRQVGRIERLMDNIVQGHGYAKAPFDAACWDILGQSLEQPVWMLLGGRMMDSAPLYRVAPQKPVNESLEEMRSYRAEGYRQFQIKVGMNWSTDIERIESSVGMLEAGETAMADANQGWRVDEALRVAKATRSLDYFLEQPCKTYEECLQIRRRIDLPIKLDECVTGMAMAQRIVADRGAEIVSLKVSNIGGLSKTRRVRDFFVDNRIPVVVEDSWGGEIASSVFAHLAVSTPADFFVNTTDLMNYNTRSTGIGGAVTKDGRFYAPDVPGLGVRADFESLGAPVAEYA